MVAGLRPRPRVGVERHPMVAAEVAQVQVDSEAVAMSPLVEAVVIVVEVEEATAAAVVTAAEAVADIVKGIIVYNSRRPRAAFPFSGPRPQPGQGQECLESAQSVSVADRVAAGIVLGLYLPVRRS